MGFISFIFKTISDIKKNKAEVQRYNTMSVSDFAKMTDDELDNAVNEIFYYNADFDNFDKYNDVQITAIVIKTFDGEIQNGGLCQFFVNPSSDYAPYVIDSLKKIGAIEICALYERFISNNNIDLSDFASFKIKHLREFELQFERFDYDEFDNNYYDLYVKENLNDMLIRYIRANADAAFKDITAFNG